MSFIKLHYQVFIPSKGVKYVSDTSDLLVDVIRIGYVSYKKGYIKAKIGLYHKTYGYFYGIKNVKMQLDDIQHWNPVRSK
jgi:hypothetical protein